MFYQYAITILSDGKTVTARDNKTGAEAKSICSPEDEFDISTGASIAIERLFQKHSKIKAGDRVKIRKDYPISYVFPYAATFVENLQIDDSLKTHYCYSVINLPKDAVYNVLAVSNNVAYIQTLTPWVCCYVVDVNALKIV